MSTFSNSQDPAFALFKYRTNKNNLGITANSKKFQNCLSLKFKLVMSVVLEYLDHQLISHRKLERGSNLRYGLIYCCIFYSRLFVSKTNGFSSYLQNGANYSEEF